MKAETYCYFLLINYIVLLINYIACNEVVLDYKIIYLY